MTINMIDCAAVTQAIESVLRAAPEIGGASVDIERSGEPPTDPTSAGGWVGIYRTGMQFPDRVAGAGYAGRLHRIDVMLMLVQTAETGPDCEERLGKLVKDTLDALLNDGSFGGTVDVLNPIEVRYPDYGRAGENQTQFRQSAIIFITGLKSI